MGGRSGWKAKAGRQPSECGWGDRLSASFFLQSLTSLHFALAMRGYVLELPNLKSEQDDFKNLNKPNIQMSSFF